MGRDADVVLIVEWRDLGAGRSALRFRLSVSGSRPETFVSAVFRRSSLGPRPFEELLPEKLRQRLSALRSSIRTARIVTNESWIPWHELDLLPDFSVTRPGRDFSRSGDAPPEGTRGDPERSESRDYSLPAGPRQDWLGIDDEESTADKGVSVEPEPRNVEVTTVIPEAVRPGESFLVEVVFHTEDYEVVVSPGSVAQPGPAALSLRDGARLTVRLVPAEEGVSVLDDPEATIEWKPPARRAEFLLAASRDAGEGVYHVRLEIWLDRVQLARAYLEIVVDPRAARSIRRKSRVLPRLPRSAFASYSRRDKDRVLDRVAALTTAGVDVFLDSLDIRQGDDWQEVLRREIGSRDRFLLFWSSAAQKSEWVEKEWRYALEKRGLDYILPNALEPPERCPPPAELGRLNFGSVIDRLRDDWHPA